MPSNRETIQDPIAPPPVEITIAQVQQILVQALTLHQQGRLGEAQTLYLQILQVEPKNFDALHLLGVIAAQTKNLEKAVELIGKAVEINPQHADAYRNLGCALQELRQYQAALDNFDKAIGLRPDHAETYFNRGFVFQHLKNYQAALDNFNKAIALKVDYAEAYNNRGTVLRDLKQPQAALENYNQAITLNPDYTEAYNNRGIVLMELEQHQAALKNYDHAIVLNPDYAEAYNNRGVVLKELKQHQAALENYDKAISLKSDFVDAYSNRGIMLRKLKRYQEALDNHNKAISFKPGHAESYINRGNTLISLGRHQAALENFDQAITLNPNCPEAYSNRGSVLRELKQFQAALKSFDQAIILKPNFPEAYHNRGVTLQELKQYQAARENYERAFALKPDYAFLEGACLHTKMLTCAWENVENQFKRLAAKIERGEKVSLPFPVLALIDSLPLQQKVAKTYVQNNYPVNNALPDIEKHPKREKIRIGYFSADFYVHPVSILTAELFESHDRAKFELTAFSFGPNTKDGMRARLEAAFDRFIDVQDQTDEEIALLARQMGIDIAVDLGGFTKDARTGIFALRAAPVQASYIGYLGTMGADFMDYLVADPVIIPDRSRHYYSEKIAYLPSYQANDSKRQVADKLFTREELGLPKKGFVFCCFNNNYKITPATYDGWMRILAKVEGSVLFLYADTDQAEVNLRKEAVQRGINGERIVFGKRIPAPEYLARYRSADLFLDTLPYNAGTTASDALWAGLPVLTCMGEAFASRVAASLLTAIGLPELITSTQAEYEALAVDLATHPRKLKALKKKLADNRLTTSLFDTPLFTRNIEAAYTAMYGRYQADLPTQDIYVKDNCAETTPSQHLQRPTNLGIAQSQIAQPSTKDVALQVQHILSQAVALHQKGQLTEAQTLYGQVLKIQPKHFDALHLLGVIAAQTNNPEKAVELISKAIEINPQQAEAYCNIGCALQELGQYQTALDNFNKAIGLKPNYTGAYNNRGNALRALVQQQAALEDYCKAIALKPDYAEAYNNRGVLLQDLKQYQDALESYGQAITLKPDYAEAYNNRGNVLRELGQYDMALNDFDKAIAIITDYADAHGNRGITLQILGQHQAALESYDKAITLKPGDANTYFNRGNTLTELKQYQVALTNYNHAITLKPDYAEAYINRSNALVGLGQHQAALESLDQAISLKPNFPEAYHNRGAALQDLKQYQSALESYKQTLSLKPDFAEAYKGCGDVLIALLQHQVALENYDKAIALKPNYEFLYGMRLHTKMHICYWDNAENQCKHLEAKIDRGEKASLPLPVLALIDSASLHKKTANIFVQHRYPRNHALPEIEKYPKREKIRIGYFSADFRNQAVSFLTAELFEIHDKTNFELTAFSLGSAKDEMRTRLETAFDHFIDVQNKSDEEIAQLARQMGIDIAVDLGGFTTDSRTGIFALRAAPIQVSYIGYLGTMGAEYIDYLIADPIIIPETSKQFYTEKIAFLPSYQVNDSKRYIADKLFTREELGLPKKGFVFCCFNHNYKITPATYDGWMRILAKVENSILFMLADNDQVALNLRKEAEQRGISGERIVFGKRLPRPEYLTRYRRADLFLDTLPYNAGTTASDALWAGLPVLTCMGEAFASRVAASLLTAIGLPELITTSQAEYEALAVDLATHPRKLKALKKKLADNRLTMPLFDTPLFTRHIEAAFTAMYERHQADLPPDDIYVQYNPNNIGT